MLEEFFTDLVEMPWWVSIILGVVFYVVVGHVIPILPIDFAMFGGIVDTVCRFGSWFAVLFLVPAGLPAERKIRGRTLVTHTRTKEALRDMDWRTFEELIESYYRKLDYRVHRQLEKGPDGGVDVRIANANRERFLIQCKYWQHMNVGVKPVRELLGIVAAEGATGGIVITSSMFTNEARAFAEGVPIELIDGDRLLHMLHDQLETTKAISAEVLADSTTQSCPRCGSDLVIRTADRGRHKGTSFYGCSAYPRCQNVSELKRD